MALPQTFDLAVEGGGAVDPYMVAGCVEGQGQRWAKYPGAGAVVVQGDAQAVVGDAVAVRVGDAPDQAARCGRLRHAGWDRCLKHRTYRQAGFFRGILGGRRRRRSRGS